MDTCKHGNIDNCALCNYVCGDSNKPGYGPTLRAAIDAAMAKDKP